MVGESSDPFAPVPVPEPPAVNLPAVQDDRTFHMVDNKGNVILCKMESGIPVKMRTVGKLKEQVRLALYNAAFANFKEKTQEEMSKMSNIELAAYNLARAAALGSGDAIEALFDRIIGKPTQSSVSVRANMNVDAALTAEDDGEGETIEAEVVE
jgi:hypothetical protein